ncbi:MAG: M3 family oligoendopeptidase [Oscillospiraceae bacterium]|nr:M3 family oligoendopeptidase [Oscillospiraceae bacterium]
MNEVWSLDALYTGFDSEKFQQDFEVLKRLCKDCKTYVETMAQDKPLTAARTYLDYSEKINLLGNTMVIYAMLRQSADTGDKEARSWIGRVMALLSEMAGPDAAAQQYLAALPNLDELIGQDPLLGEYAYLLHNIKKNSRFLLRPREEEILAKMSLSGADAWNQLWETLTSTVQVEYRGGTETLSSIRNLAYSADQAVRKDAYEAELRAYEKIKDGGAFSMNSIKLETLNECRLRGYRSPLDRSLRQAHMKQETLDALLGAMEAYLPVFWDYLRAKGKALGHENGLPWYDLFAPMGASGKKYTTAEARDYLLRIFGGFDRELRDMMDRAFRDAWIDFYPRAGKVGGAFCCEVYAAKQSRVLANFGGDFGDLVTLAHELGHAFHNEMLFDHRILNLDLPMPLAETASTFNENVLVSAAIAAATDPGEKLALIENQLMDACQIICDIYSRFLFEKSVFESRDEQFLSADDLCEKMLAAQKTAYGSGLDQDALHPYMWLCKSHYYSGGLSYYNFPYAFGGLFARGLYAMYREEGASFVPKYKALLRATTVMDAEEAARVCGVDLTDKAFWEKGLRSFAEEIGEYQALLGNTGKF